MGSNVDDFESVSSDSFESESELNGDKENTEINEILVANQEYIRATQKKSNFEFGFENIKNSSQKNPKPKIESKSKNKKNGNGNDTHKRKHTSGQEASTEAKRQKLIKNSNGVNDERTQQAKNPIAIAGNSSSVANAAAKENEHSGVNSGENSTLWNYRKLSNTRYLDEYFYSAGQLNGKLQVSCKICDPTKTHPFSITSGNNSNLMKHLKGVSCFSVYNFTCVISHPQFECFCSFIISRFIHLFDIFRCIHLNFKVSKRRRIMTHKKIKRNSTHTKRILWI